MDTIRNSKHLTAMPPGSISYQDDAPIRASTNSLCKLLQSNGENLDIDRGQQQPMGISRFRTCKTVHIEPFIALLYANEEDDALSAPRHV
jgi:hypothetical protein